MGCGQRKMATMAGAKNIAADIIPATFGTINPEQIITSNPDQYVGTSVEHPPLKSMSGIIVGPGVDISQAKRALSAYMEKHPGFSDLKATKNGHVHAIWHDFYDSPYNFIAIEQMAKWFHPDLFADIDPETSFREVHERFLPIDYHPGYFISIDAPAAN